MLEQLLSLDNRTLQKYIKNCSGEEKEKILTNEQIKQKFILDIDDYPFIWLIQSLNKRELDLFLDDVGIGILISSNNLEHKLNALITLDTNLNFSVLSKEKMLAMIYKYYNKLCYFLSGQNIVLVENFYQYIVKNNLNFSYMTSFGKHFHDVLKKHIDEVIEKDLITKNNINTLDRLSIEELLNSNYFVNIILDSSFDIEKFDELVLKGTKFNESILADKRFKDKVILNRDVSCYRFLINELIKNNNLSYIADIEKLREDYYDKTINSYSGETQMFKKYEYLLAMMVDGDNLIDQDNYFQLDIGDKISKSIAYDINIIYFNHDRSNRDKLEEIKKLFIDLTKVEFNEILIDRYYKDVPYNFLLNLNNLINFNENNLAISKENLDRYQKIRDLYSKKEVDINFYNNFDKSTDFVSEFYDDFVSSKKLSYNLINNSLVDVNKIQGQKNLNDTKTYGVDIYDFVGEDFYLLIHNTSVMKQDNSVETVFNSRLKKDITSLSLISSRRVDYYNDYMPSIVLGFCNIDTKQIVHLYNSDSFSHYIKKDNEVSSRVTKLYTPESLINETKGYNEIVYQVDNKNTDFLGTNKLLPSYVITFGNIEVLDVEVAKKFGVPILNINKEKYKDNLLKSSISVAIRDNENYIDSYFELRNKVR